MTGSFSFTLRKPIPLSKKLNPIWWFQNDGEQRLNDGTTDWYMPSEPEWKRRLFWEFRNPLQNLRNYVLGVGDKNYTVTGKDPVLTVQRNDLSETGWQWAVLHGGDLWVPRPFVSYSGERVTWYFGWQPTGFFGAKFNLHKEGNTMKKLTIVLVLLVGVASLAACKTTIYPQAEAGNVLEHVIR